MKRIAAAVLVVASCGAPPSTEPAALDVAADVRPRAIVSDAHGFDVPTTTIPRRVPTTTRASRSRPRPPVATPAPTPTGDVWWRLALCESGGNPQAVSSTGRYRGAFQFSLATWRSVGMAGDPIQFDYETQLIAAKRLQARSGWGQWPRCARKLGLL